MEKDFDIELSVIENTLKGVFTDAVSNFDFSTVLSAVPVTLGYADFDITLGELYTIKGLSVISNDENIEKFKQDALQNQDFVDYYNESHKEGETIDYVFDSELSYCLEQALNSISGAVHDAVGKLSYEFDGDAYSLFNLD